MLKKYKKVNFTGHVFLQIAWFSPCNTSGG
jgi:hypothetical protein